MIEPPHPRSSAPPEFHRAVDAFGLRLDDHEVDRLARFIDRLLETNRSFNLTAITEPDAVWMRHIFDSLTLLPYIVQADAKQVIDIGSGGGLPGVPLAIALPEVQFTLLEATGKKAKFLESCVQELHLDNITVVNDRAETIGRDPVRYRDKFDIAAARAVGPLAVLLELAAPLVRVGGLILAIKGERAQDELDAARKAMHLLHCAAADVNRTETGSIVVIEKLRATPHAYPRRPGEPKKSPLGT